MPVTIIENDGHFQQEMSSQGVKLVVVDFFATWCGPCVRIAPLFEQLSQKYSKATFLKVDVDNCRQTAAAQSISAMPTFILYRNKTKLETLTGADAAALERLIQKHYDVTTSGDDEDVPTGQMNLATYIHKGQCEALNDSDDHPLAPFLENGNSYLESDCDPQLIISIAFSQGVKIHSIKFKGPYDNGPKTVKLFINQPTTLDFDAAVDNNPTQELVLTPENLTGNPVNLRFVKFQNVQNLQVFVKDNQSDSDVTRIDEMTFFGSPVATTNMGDFKRIAGKKGEAH